MDTQFLPTPPVNEQQMIDQVLNEAPANFRDMVPAAIEWLQGTGALTDWHINCIILDSISSCKYIKNIEMEIDRPGKYIKCMAVVKWWTAYLPYRRRRVLSTLKDIFAKYAPTFNVDLSFKTN